MKRLSKTDSKIRAGSARRGRLHRALLDGGEGACPCYSFGDGGRSPLNGEMPEWPKGHDWKSCVPQGTEGSNPSLSAAFRAKQLAALGDAKLTNPARPGRE